MVRKSVGGNQRYEKKTIKTSATQSETSEIETEKPSTTQRKSKPRVEIEKGKTNSSSLTTTPNKQKLRTDPELKKKLRRQYLREIRKKVKAHTKYPYAARRLGLESSVAVRFTILSTGRVGDIRFPKAAHHLLQKACVKAIRSASPFRKVPTTIGVSITVETVLSFKIK